MRTESQKISHDALSPLSAMDLFVKLEKAFRRRTRKCGKCGFSLPYPTTAGNGGSWNVLFSENCEARCRAILEDLVDQYRANYRLYNA